jgi:uncharacterized protein (TIGR02757 family)
MDKSLDSQLFEYLELKTRQFNQPDFWGGGGGSIPHSFTNKEDIEISGLLTALISWGNRKSIIKSAKNMMHLLDNRPFEFICHASLSEKRGIEKFVHRTFNGADFLFVVDSLKRIYLEENGLEYFFNNTENPMREFEILRASILNGMPNARTGKHFANPAKNSAAKRLNMYLRWMVRKDDSGVDFGIWQTVSPSVLRIPLDVHSGNTARSLGLLERAQNDAKSVEILTDKLKSFDASDPVKYDFALFGIGVYETAAPRIK